jgi:hypothetical protein
VAIALSIAIALLFLTVFGHYEIIQLVALLRKQWPLRGRMEILLLTAVTVPFHLASIVTYAAVYYWMSSYPELGFLASMHHEFSGDPSDFLYFSITCYTTLGFGDIYSTGPMRLVAAIEGLNGLMLITLSASLAYASATAVRDQD